MLLRNRMLNTTSFILAPPDDQAARQAERDAIVVESNKVEDEKEEENENDTAKVDEKEPEAEEDKEDDKEEDTDEDSEDEEEKEPSEDEVKANRKKDRTQRRIDRLTAEAKAARTELEELRKRLSEQPKEGLSEEEVNRRAEEIAAKKLKDAEAAKEMAEKDKLIEKLAKEGNRADKQFDDKVDEMAKEVAPIPMDMIEILGDLDHGNGGEVLAYLANNVDEYEDFFDSNMKPVNNRKMTRMLDKLSEKLYEAKQTKPKARTKVPPPVGDVETNGKGNGLVLTGKEDQETFNRIRQRQIEERMKTRGY